MHISRTTHTHTPADTDTRAAIAVRLAAATIARLTAEIVAVCGQRPTDPAERAARALRLEQLHARLARWWAVLQRATDHGTVPFVYIDAVIRARSAAENDARFWRETAADWTARALRRPTSDTAGAMSNWHDLGITDLDRPHLAETAPAIGAQR